MKTPHKHAELIKAWADGAEIEIRSYREWTLLSNPRWDSERDEYRIKPEPKPDVVRYGVAFVKLKLEDFGGVKHFVDGDLNPDNNIKLTFDGETGKLIEAEVIS